MKYLPLQVVMRTERANYSGKCSNRCLALPMSSVNIGCYCNHGRIERFGIESATTHRAGELEEEIYSQSSPPGISDALNFMKSGPADHAFPTLSAFPVGFPH